MSFVRVEKTGKKFAPTIRPRSTPTIAPNNANSTTATSVIDEPGLSQNVLPNIEFLIQPEEPPLPSSQCSVGAVNITPSSITTVITPTFTDKTLTSGPGPVSGHKRGRKGHFSNNGGEGGDWTNTPMRALCVVESGGDAVEEPKLKQPKVVKPTTISQEIKIPSVQRLGPRIKINAAGERVIDVTSLQVSHSLLSGEAGEGEAGEEVVEDVESERYVNYSTYMKRQRHIRWSLGETNLFYQVPLCLVMTNAAGLKGLAKFGTDFEMIATTIFPDRNRRHIKAKFLTEEKKHSDRITNAIMRRDPGCEWTIPKKGISLIETSEPVEDILQQLSPLVVVGAAAATAAAVVEGVERVSEVLVSQRD